VIAPEALEEVTKGGIIISHQTKEKEDAASMRGLLVAVSPIAFNYDTYPDGSRIAKVGDHVLFSKYAGVLYEGPDGREYRICKDKEIIGVIEGAE
jgi:chaperonin GroES